MTNSNDTTIPLSFYSRVCAYLELCKPGVVALMLVTTWVGMCLASPDMVPIPLLFFTLVGVGCGAGAAAVLNHVIECEIDLRMWRTKKRPLPTGKLSTYQALTFASILGALSMLILATKVNGLTAFLTLITLVGYAIVYTIFLKKQTPQNIVIGGLSGAVPPLLGWTAVTGHIGYEGLLLALIIFVWTPPHFWALAIARFQDYEKSTLPMLPVTHGIPFTQRAIVLYTWLLLSCSLLPYAIGMSGPLYGISALILGILFLGHSYYLARQTEHLPRIRQAMRTFHYSIAYLFILFIILLIDHYL